MRNIYVKNIEGLNEFLGYSENEFSGEEIGYGEKAVIFRDVTELCEDFDDFAQNAEFGQAFEFDGKYICKAGNVNGDAVLFYEDENEEIIGF